MGAANDTPRKRRHRLAKVPKGAEANNIHLAGLSGESGATSSRLDHELAHGRSSQIGSFGRFFLWLLGRRAKEETTE